MTDGGTADDEVARRARADAIRHLRDVRNAQIGTPAAETPADGTEEAPGEPNYVDLIDRKMRETETG